jgi:SLT domain-containing protein
VRYAEQLTRLNEAKALELEALGGYQALELQMQTEHATRLAQIDAAKNQAMLASGQQLFDGLAGAAASFAGEQSGAYAAMFAVSKAFAVAQAGLQLSAAMTQVLGDPTALTPAQKFANVAAVAAAGGALVSAVGSASFSGRAMGGPVQANQMYRVNEGGKPEIFNAANGSQYMMPNQRGEVVSNADASGGGQPTVIVNIQNNASGSTATATSRVQDQQTIIDVVVSNVMQNGKIAQAVNRTTGTRRAGG